VHFDFEEAFPTTFASWRGDYNQLALGFDLSGYNQKRPNTTPQTVEELIAKAYFCDGMMFQGWKGGGYQMSMQTPICIANPGNAGNTILTRVL